MWTLDRDRIWRFAWSCVPIAIAVNLYFGIDIERSTRFADQARVDADAGQWAEAGARYALSAEADPGTPIHAFNAAVSYMKAGDFVRALEWNEEALRRDPTFQPALDAMPTLEVRARRGK